MGPASPADPSSAEQSWLCLVPVPCQTAAGAAAARERHLKSDCSWCCSSHPSSDGDGAALPGCPARCCQVLWVGSTWQSRAAAPESAASASPPSSLAGSQGNPGASPRMSQGGGSRGAPPPLALAGQAPCGKGDLSHARAVFPMSGCHLGDRTFKAPLPEQSRSPAHPKSPFAATSYDLKLKQGSMNNVTRSFFSSCLQILRG